MKLVCWVPPSQISAGYRFVAEIAALNHLPTPRYQKQKAKAAEVCTGTPSCARLDACETFSSGEWSLGRVLLNVRPLRNLQAF